MSLSDCGKITEDCDELFVEEKRLAVQLNLKQLNVSICKLLTPVLLERLSLF